MAQIGTTTCWLLYPSHSTCTTVTSPSFASGLRTAVFIKRLWLGLTLRAGPSTAPSSSVLALSGSHLISLVSAPRLQLQRCSSSTLPPATIAAILIVYLWVKLQS